MANNSRLSVWTGKAYWSFPNGKLLYTIPLYASEVIWSPNGKYIACILDVKTSSGYANPEIAIWIA